MAHDAREILADNDFGTASRERAAQVVRSGFETDRWTTLPWSELAPVTPEKAAA